MNLLTINLDDLLHNPILAAAAAVVQGRISIRLANPNAITVGNPNVLAIIDQSGSMSGYKIQRANEAVAALVDRVPDGTRMLIVYFSTNFRVLEVYDNSSHVMINDPDGAVVVDQTTRQSIQDEIMSMDSQSATYFAAPHRHGQNWLLRQSGPKFAVTATDGHSSDSGTDDPVMQNFASQLGAAGVNLYFAGIGGDYDFNTLNSWAAFADGLARVIHVDDAAGLQTLLEGIGKKIQRAVFSDFAVNFHPVPDVQVRKVIHLGTPPVELPVLNQNRLVEHPNAGSMDVTYGIPYIVQFLWETVPPVGQAIDIARVQVFYTDATGARQEENLLLQIGVTADAELVKQNQSGTAIATMQQSGVQATFSQAVAMMTRGETMLQTARTAADRTAAQTMIEQGQTMLEKGQKRAHQVSPDMGTAYDSFIGGVGGGVEADQAKAYTRTILASDTDLEEFLNGQGGKS